MTAVRQSLDPGNAVPDVGATASASAVIQPPRRPVGVPTAISADLLKPPARGLDRLLVALVALVLGFIVWASFAMLQEVASGHGRVIPASKIQVVQNLEGGIVREVLVREGQTVREGDVILRIDPTLAGSSLGETREKILGLKALLARLDAEVEGKPLTFPSEVAEQAPELIVHQRNHYEARKRELDSAIAALDSQARQRAQEIVELESKVVTLTRALEISKEDLALLKPLERSKAASRSEVLQAEAKTNDIAGSLDAARLALPRVKSALQEARDRVEEKRSAYRGDALQKLSSAKVELAALSEQSRWSEDKVSRTTVRAPASGIVKTINVTTAGQVVQPGSSLVEIVPMNDTLLVEAQVRPQDIAFLRPGQDAIVKLTAYDYSIYGGLKGRVEHIGADSVTTDKGDTYYLIRVRTAETTLKRDGAALPIIPGMVADVDVLIGAKSVMTYLIKPITRLRHSAMRER